MRNSWKNNNTGRNLKGIGRRAAALVMAAFMTVSSMQSDLGLVSQAAPASTGSEYATPASGADKKSAIPSEARNKGAIDISGSGFVISFNNYGSNTPSIPIKMGSGSSEMTPAFTVVYNKPDGNTDYLTLNEDYTIVGWNNNTRINFAENASVTIQGQGKYTGTKTAEFKIVPNVENDFSAKLSSDGSIIRNGETKSILTKRYNGKALGADDGIVLPTVFSTVNLGYAPLSWDYAGRTTGYWIESEDTEAGAATLSVKLGSAYAYQSLLFNYTILPRVFSSNVTATVEGSGGVYDGTAKTPSVKVTDNELGKTLSLNTDYTVEYTNNVNAGEASITITGKGNYDNSFVVKKFTIEKADIRNATVTLPQDSYAYTGNDIKPEPTVTLGGEVLLKTRDYTVDYSNVQGVRGANETNPPTVKVSGTGNYTGIATKSFSITSSSLKSQDISLYYNGVKIGEDSSNGNINVADKMGLVYNRTQQTPAIIVKKNGTPITSGVTISWDSNKNAGSRTATVSPKAGSSYQDSFIITYTIGQKPVDSEDIVVESHSISNGKVTIVLKDGESTMNQGPQNDYTLTNDSVDAAGAKKVTINGKGNYKGSREYVFGSGTDISTLASKFELYDPVLNSKLGAVAGVNSPVLYYYPSDEKLKAIVYYDGNPADIESSDGFEVNYTGDMSVGKEIAVSVSAKNTSTKYYGSVSLKYIIRARNTMTKTPDTEFSYSINGTSVPISVATPNVAAEIGNTGDVIDLGTASELTFIFGGERVTLKYGEDYEITNASHGNVIPKNTTDSIPYSIRGKGNYAGATMQFRVKLGKKALSSDSIVLKYRSEETGVWQTATANKFASISYDGENHQYEMPADVQLFDTDKQAVIPSGEYEISKYVCSAGDNNFRSDGQEIRIYFSVTNSDTYSGENSRYYYGIDKDDSSLYTASLVTTSGAAVPNNTITYAGNQTWVNYKVQVRKKTGNKQILLQTDYTWAGFPTTENLPITPGQHTFDITGISFTGSIPLVVNINGVGFNSNTLKSSGGLYHVEPQALQSAIDNGSTLDLELKTNGELYCGSEQLDLSSVCVKDARNNEIIKGASITGIQPGNNCSIGLTGYGSTATIKVKVTQSLANAVWYEKNIGEETKMAYTGSEILPDTIGIYLGQKKITRDNVYKCTIKKGNTTVNSIRDVGTYTLTLTPNSSVYTGTATLTVTVYYDLSGQNVTFTYSGGVYPGNRITYTGQPIKPTNFSLSVAGEVLKRGTDYTVEITSATDGTACIKPGKVSVSAVAMENSNASGTKTSETGYEILTLPFEDPSIIVTVQEMTYDPARTNGWESDITMTVTKDGQQLVNGTDYTVDARNVAEVNGCPQAGTYQLLIICTDNAAGGTIDGTRNVDLKIKPRNMANANITFPGSVFYAGGEEALPVSVSDAGHVMSTGDYNITAAGNNKETGPNAKVTLSGTNTESGTGTGNYYGRKTVNYTISPLDLGSLDDSCIILSNDSNPYTGQVHNDPTITIKVPSGKGYVLLDSKAKDSSNRTLFGNPVWTGALGGNKLLNKDVYKLTIGYGLSDNVTGQKEISSAYEITAYPIMASMFKVDNYENYPGTGSVTLSNYVHATKVNNENPTFEVTSTETGGTTVNSAGKYPLTIKGTGNYTGTVTALSIQIGRDIEKASNVTISKTYDGSSDYPKEKKAGWGNFKYGSDPLEMNTDYTVGNTTATDAGKSYQLTVTGIGKYYGTKTLTYVIDPISGAYAYIKYADSRMHSNDSWYMYYTGTALSPAIEVYIRNNGIESDALDASQYSVQYENNVNAGTATVKVTLTNYDPVAASPLPATFTIKPVDLSANTITAVFADTMTDTMTRNYTGSELKPMVDITGTNPDGANIMPMSSTDYTVTYTNNTNAGEATATITGKGNFTGSRGLKFSIIGDFGDSKSKFTIPKQMYTGQAISKLVNPVVEVGGNTLKEADYTVTLTSSDNWETKGIAVFTPVSGSKYYTGTKTVEFVISGDDSMYTVRGVANAYTYSGSPIKPIALITDANGNGINYKTSEVTYKNTSDGTVCIKPGMVTMTIPLTAGTSSTNTSSANKAATISTNKEIKYQILQKNINSCAIGTASNVAYDGKAHTPEISIVNGTLALGANTDYTITYQNNIYPGRARIKLNGKGNYTGSADVYFTITMPDVKNLSATATASGKIKVSWKKSSGTYTGYRISYRAGSGTQKQVNVGKSKTSKVLSGLSSGKTYTIIIQTYYKASNGKVGYGNASVVTQDSKPAKATSVKATALGSKKVKVTWKKVSGASGYMIYRKEGNGKYKRIKTITSGSTVSYTNSGLKKDTKYTYRVLTYRLNGTKRTYSDYSAAAAVKAK